MLDEYSTFSCVAYLSDARFEEAPLVMLSSHYSNWWNSYLIDFTNYWQLLTTSRGISELRRDILGATDGHNLPPIKNLNGSEKPFTPKLFV